MSCYEWEHGEIKLPTGVAAKLKAHLNVVADRHVAELVKETSAAWDQLKASTPSKRQEVYYRLQISEDASMLLQRHTYNEQTRRWDTKFAKPTQAVIKKSVVDRRVPWGADAKAPKNLVFKLGCEATITFTGANTVVWDVPENNHAAERANEHPLAGAFFDFLENRVEWTSRSGGTITGNNEYNRDDHDAGGGANYVVREYSKKAVADRRAARRDSFGTYRGRTYMY